jgi:hypothetical protein
MKPSAFAEKYRDILKTKNTVLVLGLGFAYHVQALAEILSQYHQSYSIIVIERCSELHKEAIRNKLIPSHTSVLTPQCPEALFKKEIFIDFLLDKPQIIKHDTSFNLHLDYYKNILSYHANSSIQSYSDILSNESKSYLDSSASQTIESIPEIAQNEKSFYLLNALNSLR